MVIPVPISVEEELKNKTIIFYDGECALCNWGIQFLLKRDKYKRFVFAPLQSPTAQKFLEDTYVNNKKTVVVLYQNKKYYRSTAVLIALKELGKGWQILYIFKIVPEWIRDYFYAIIAKNRKRWFGATRYCRLPDEISNY